MNNNTPVSLVKKIRNSRPSDLLNKASKVILLCLPLVFLTTASYSMNSTEIITSHSITDILDSPNKAIIGFGLMEQKIHFIALLFMAFLMYMGHKDQIIKKLKSLHLTPSS